MPHLITLLFIFFQFIQFLPSDLLGLTASASISGKQTLFQDASGEGSASWTLSEDGKTVSWDVTITKNQSETETAPYFEMRIGNGVTPPKVESASINGSPLSNSSFQTKNGKLILQRDSFSLSKETLKIKLTQTVQDSSSPTLSFQLGGGILLVDESPSVMPKEITIPNRFAQLEAERIAAEEAAKKSEEERVVAEEAAKKEAEEAAAKAEAEKKAAEAEAKAKEEAEKQAAEAAENTEESEETTDFSKEENVEETTEQEEAKEEPVTEETAEKEEKVETPAMTEKSGGISIASAGSYTLDFSAYDPRFYDFKMPADYPTPPSGRAEEPMPGANSAQTVESLQPRNLALGQIVPFEVEITVTGSTSPENGVIQFTSGFSTHTTNGSNIGFDPNYMIYAAFVDTLSPYHVDQNENATVRIVNSTVVNQEIQGTFEVSGLDQGDVINVEIWVVLKSQFPSGNVGGNVQTRMITAKTANGNNISLGNQTVPLQQPSSFTSVQADVGIVKTDEPDPIYAGEELTYDITVTNYSTTNVANGIVIEDTLDSNVTFIRTEGFEGTLSGNTVTWPAFALGPGDSRTFQVVVRVNEDAPTDNFGGTGPDNRGIASTTRIAGVDITNIVKISAMVSADPNTNNNQWQEPTNVLPRMLIKARKVWVGGPEENHRAVELTLRRTVDGETYEKVSVEPEISGEDPENHSFDYVWNNLPRYDANGNEYTYDVIEAEEVENYESEVVYDESEGIWIVTNTYQSPKDPITAIKRWVNGPEDKPTVYFQLYRQVGDGAPEEVGEPVLVTDVNGTGTYDVEVDMGEHDRFNSNGELYTYFVREIMDSEEFTSVADGLTVVNTYQISKMNISGTKRWVNDTEAHRSSTLLVRLHRRIGSGPLEQVAEITTSAQENWAYDFGEQDRTNENGAVYTYSITEEVPANYNEEYETPYYEENELKLDVTNTLVRGNLYILKTDLDGNPITHESAEFTLTRISPLNPEEEPEQWVQLTGNDGRVVFEDLPAGEYLLEETKAPEGYELLMEDVVITIEKDENGETVVRMEDTIITAENPLVLRNKPYQSLPATGGMGTTLFTLFGLAMMGSAMYGFKKNKKKDQTD